MHSTPAQAGNHRRAAPMALATDEADGFERVDVPGRPAIGEAEDVLVLGARAAGAACARHRAKILPCWLNYADGLVHRLAELLKIEPATKECFTSGGVQARRPPRPPRQRPQAVAHARRPAIAAFAPQVRSAEGGGQSRLTSYPGDRRHKRQGLAHRAVGPQSSLGRRDRGRGGTSVRRAAQNTRGGWGWNPTVRTVARRSARSGLRSTGAPQEDDPVIVRLVGGREHAAASASSITMMASMFAPRSASASLAGYVSSSGSFTACRRRPSHGGAARSARRSRRGRRRGSAAPRRSEAS